MLFRSRQGGDPVMARQGTVLVATFHPEVIGEQTIHRYFCEMVLRAAGRRGAEAPPEARDQMVRRATEGGRAATTERRAGR